MTREDDIHLAVDYARYSTEAQDSIEDQQAMNTECASEIPARIVAHFSDAAVSRSIQDRKGLTQLLAFFPKHPDVNILIIPALDRLIGDLAQHTDVFRMLSKYKIRLFVEDEELDYTDDRELARAEQAAVASAEEVRKARRRTRRGLRIKNKSSVPVYTSRPPFGLSMVPVLGPDGRPIPKGTQLLDDKGRVRRSASIERDMIQVGGKTNFEWLEFIFREVAAGTKVWSVARTLTDAGVRTKNGNAYWTTQGINRIVRNRTYLGERTWGLRKTVHDYDGKKQVLRDEDDRDVIRGDTNLGPVIDAEIWLKANEVMSGRYHGWKSDVRRNAPRVLDGLVFCGRCGMKMYAKRDRKILATGEQARTWRYYCTGQSRAVPGHLRKTKGGEFVPYCTRSHSMSERRLLLSLEGLQAPMAPKDAKVSWIMVPKPKPGDTEVADLQASIQVAEGALDRIEDAYENGDYDRDGNPEAARQTRQNRRTRHLSIIETAKARLMELAEEADREAGAEEAPEEIVTVMHESLHRFAAMSVMDVYDDMTLEDVTAARVRLREIVSRRVGRIEVDAPDYTIFMLKQPLTRAR